MKFVGPPPPQKKKKKKQIQKEPRPPNIEKETKQRKEISSERISHLIALADIN